MPDRGQLYTRIVSGEAGLWASPLRACLGAAEFAYLGVIKARNRYYDRAKACTRLPVPVISVGNLTAGGTGKTPMVMTLVRRLLAQGKNPAVVSRGYRAGPDEDNDEVRMIRTRFPEVSCVCGPDRVEAAWKAIRHFHADVLVLDDAFQHRRLARTLDIVLIDATCPFGYGRLLPRGFMREPIEGLRRAGLIILTRCNQAAAAAVAQTEKRLRTLAPAVDVIQSEHRVIAVTDVQGNALSDRANRRAILFAGIGQPQAFALTCRELGYDIAGTHWFPDHHAYRPRDLDRLDDLKRRAGADLLLTTEKDAVKLRDAARPGARQIGVVRIDIDFLGEGDTILAAHLDRVLRETADK